MDTEPWTMKANLEKITSIFAEIWLFFITGLYTWKCNSQIYVFMLNTHVLTIMMSAFKAPLHHG